MKVLVTGATGYLGQALCRELTKTDHLIHALCRSQEKAKSIKYANTKIFLGQIWDPKALKAAMQGCDCIFHMAAHTRMWEKDASIFQKVNVEATELLLNLALENKVNKVIFTSTGGTMEPYEGQTSPVCESQLYFQKPSTEYVRSKLLAEKKVLEFSTKGIHAVVLNPTRIFGPGPDSKSNAVTRMIKLFKEGKWRVIPGSGQSEANYVYIDDVIKGHLLAAEKGAAGQNYILGGTNISYTKLYSLLRELTGSKQNLFKIPIPIILLYAKFQVLMARSLGHEPIIVPSFARKLTKHWPVTSDRAIHELGYSITPLREGILHTLNWLEKECLQAQLKK